MAGDRAARRVARIRKWHELIERHGSDEAAHYAIRESPEWAMTYELYPSHLLDEGRRTLALDLMIAADKETGDASTSRRREKRVAKGTAGSPDTLYPRDEIKRALSLWRGRSTSPQEISRSSIARPGFSRTAVRRVIRLDEHGAFELGSRGGLRLLGINGEFRAAPKKVSLRALERALGLAPLA